MATAYGLVPIGIVRASRAEVIDDDWDSVAASVELDPEVVDADAALGLSTFSHAEIIFVFDRVAADAVCRGARHPRGRAEWPLTGILAQRAKDRPNRLGSTICRVVAVDGLRIDVSGLDAVDGTPVVDIKPWMSGFAPRGELREPEWAAELMAGYW